MDLKHVLYEQTDDVVKVTVNRPEVMNSISRRVYAELDEAFAAAEDDDSVKVIVVAGAGDNFGAGHDLGSAVMRGEVDDYPRDRSAIGRVKSMDRGVYWRLHDRWRNIGKPTIAMIQGYCIMGSWMLAASCDLAVASEDAKFADRSVRWGGAHHEYPTHFWELGIKKAKEYLWTGDFIDAAEAHRLGMVNRVVPLDQLEEATMWLAGRIALNDLYALKVSKMSVNQAADIMGQSAAVRSSGNFWLMGRPGEPGRGTEDDPSRVAWSKQQNERFDEQERDGTRPW
ncbi:MAG: enoyl-CoA hydratase-related protein [Dehalococcoidia bacterium]|jgi:enoyl-CoA hydratase|nr:enoyl-CoA hydratase-related protein [Dehalococcoidia bacterium]